MLPFLRKHLINTCKRIIYSCSRRNFSAASLLLLFGLLLILGGTGFGAFMWLHYLNLGYGAPTGTVMLPALMIIVGFQMLLGFLSIDVASVPQEPIQQRLGLLRPKERRRSMPVTDLLSDRDISISPLPVEEKIAAFTLDSWRAIMLLGNLRHSRGWNG